MNNVIYCLGNPLSKQDNLPLEMMPRLKNKFPHVDFIHLDPTEIGDITNNPVIIDTVCGIGKVQIFNDLSCFKRSPRNSTHDYDLPIFLGIMRKIKKIDSFTIIGVPEKYKLGKAVLEVGKAIKHI